MEEAASRASHARSANRPSPPLSTSSSPPRSGTNGGTSLAASGSGLRSATTALLPEPTDKFCEASKALWADEAVKECFEKISCYAMDKVRANTPSRFLIPGTELGIEVSRDFFSENRPLLPRQAGQANRSQLRPDGHRPALLLRPHPRTLREHRAPRQHRIQERQTFPAVLIAQLI